MNRLLIYVALIAAIFASCKEDATVEIKTSGTLTIHLVDSLNNPIANQALTLYTLVDYKLAKVYSDENGYVNFGSLNYGNYFVDGINIEDNGLLYSFEKFVQVVSGEDKLLTITPSDYSVTLTLHTYQVLPTGSGTYSSPNALKTGTIALVPNLYIPTDYEKINRYSIMTKELDNSNIITFYKVPYGEYKVYAFIDEDHISTLYNKYSNDYDIYSNYSDIYITDYAEKVTEALTFYSHRLFDYKADLTLEIDEVIPLSYSKNTAQPLTEGNIALIPIGSYNSESSFDELKNSAVATMNISSDQVTFNDIPIGTYYYMVYFDSEHYTFAGYSKENSINQISQYLPAEGNNTKIFVYSPYIKDYTFDIKYYVHGYNPKPDIKVYLLKDSDYSDMSSSERYNEQEVEKLAFSSGTTDSDGYVTLKTPAYERVYMICFDEYQDNSIEYGTFYSEPTDYQSISFY